MTSTDFTSPLVRYRELVTPELQREIEQFLFVEARILDERRIEEWYKLLADDLHYYMPTRYNRARREMKYEFSAPNEAALFDDDKPSIWQRIKRLQSGAAWSEEPPSRTRHLITNIEVHPTVKEHEFEVESCYVLYRSRLETDVDIFVGSRHDLLRRVEGSLLDWQIVNRIIILDQAVVQATNMSIFF
jgi:biphenyl 2,3-dioxygenase subunit beta